MIPEVLKIWYKGDRPLAINTLVLRHGINNVETRLLLENLSTPFQLEHLVRLEEAGRLSVMNESLGQGQHNVLRNLLAQL